MLRDTLSNNMQPSDIYFASNYLGTIFVSKRTWHATERLETEMSDEMYSVINTGIRAIEDALRARGNFNFVVTYDMGERRILEILGFTYNQYLEVYLQPGSYPDYDAMDPTCPPVEKRRFRPKNYSFGIGTLDGQVVDLYFAKYHGKELTAELWGWEISSIENLCQNLGISLYQTCEGEFSILTPKHNEIDLLRQVGFVYNSDLDRS